MLRITHGEESSLTSWFFQIDRRLLKLVLILMGIGILASFSAGAANAAKLGHPWYFFGLKTFVFYTVGIVALVAFSILNKKQIIKLSVIGLIVGIVGLLITRFYSVDINSSSRWLVIGGFKLFMPAEILKPSFIILTAWFLEKMHSVYGDNIFSRDAFGFKTVSWWPYILLFVTCVAIIFSHPDFGMSLLYLGVLAVMLLIAKIPLKMFFPVIGVGVIILSAIAMKTMGHVQGRSGQIFYLEPRSQVWFSVNAIKHGGLFGSGEKAFIKDKIAESANDFVYASFAEDFGAIAACALIVILFLVLNNLIKHAFMAKDEFVVYVLAGTAALFGGQVCFNLMTSLHLVISKGMTLPFVSYGGWSVIVLCVLFGMVLGLIREDTWNR